MKIFSYIPTQRTIQNACKKIKSHVMENSQTRRKIYRPSGLNATEMTASAWPGMVLVHLVTALTLNIAWGRYTISRTCSLSSKALLSSAFTRVSLTSTSLTKKEYGIGSSCNQFTYKILVPCIANIFILSLIHRSLVQHSVQESGLFIPAYKLDFGELNLGSNPSMSELQMRPIAKRNFLANEVVIANNCQTNIHLILARGN